MRSVIATIAAVGVLVAGAFTATMLSSDPAAAQDAASADPSTADVVGPREEVLDEVLEGLVADGTLSQAQADAVEERLVAAHEELAAERRAMREARRDVRDLIRGFLEDDVITRDELAQLPDDHPFNDPDGPLGEALEDGQITRDELRGVGEELRMERRERRKAFLGLDD